MGLLGKDEPQRFVLVHHKKCWLPPTSPKISMRIHTHSAFVWVYLRQFFLISLPARNVRPAVAESLSHTHLMMFARAAVPMAQVLPTAFTYKSHAARCHPAHAVFAQVMDDCESSEIRERQRTRRRSPLFFHLAAGIDATNAPEHIRHIHFWELQR